MQSEIDFENHRNKYDSMNSNFATFYDRMRDRDQEIEEELQDFDDRMQRKHLASVMANTDKVERAREITEKMRVKQIEHEVFEKKRMEEVFAEYMQRRIKAEEKVTNLIKKNHERIEYEKHKSQEKLSRIRTQHDMIVREEEKRRRVIAQKTRNGKFNSTSSPDYYK